jgi:hypothetical protein
VVSTFFVDTSALAKRYLTEIGTDWALSWIEPHASNVILISELALVEMRSLLQRRMREGSLTSDNAARLKGDFRIHAQREYLVVLLETSLLNMAEHLIDQHSLRTLDAMQLACALHSRAILDETITFVSADKNLLKAAAAEGFPIENPTDHP